jgi:hypothetical protein
MINDVISEEPSAEFELVLEFERHSSTPQRIFQALSDLIVIFGKLDNELSKTINLQLEAQLVLEDIEIGSIRTKLALFIRNIPDEAIKDLDWKKLVGYFLLKAKYLLLKFLEERPKVDNREQIEHLLFEIQKEAEQTDIKQLPAYGRLPITKLVDFIIDIQNALNHLQERDKIEYRSRAGSVYLNRRFNPSNLHYILAENSNSWERPVILKVKKPDYLGESMWDFKLERKTISAKIIDYTWLNSFHNGYIPIKPGDSISVVLRTEDERGQDYKLIKTHYNILKVNEVIRKEPPSLFNSSENYS